MISSLNPSCRWVLLTWTILPQYKNKLVFFWKNRLKRLHFTCTQALGSKCSIWIIHSDIKSPGEGNCFTSLLLLDKAPSYQMNLFQFIKFQTSCPLPGWLTPMTATSDAKYRVLSLPIEKMKTWTNHFCVMNRGQSWRLTDFLTTHFLWKEAVVPCRVCPCMFPNIQLDVLELNCDFFFIMLYQFSQSFFFRQVRDAFRKTLFSKNNQKLTSWNCR